MAKEKFKNMIKTDYGNVDRDQYLKSVMMHGKINILRFKKWLKIQNKKLGTNFTIADFDKDD